MHYNKITRGLLIAATLSSTSLAAHAASTEFQMGGYIKSGILVNQDGKKSDRFRMSGNFGTFRLGNEQDNKVELNPTMNMKSDNGAVVRVKGSFSAESGCTSDWNCVDNDGHEVQFRQGYVEMQNLDFAPNQVFWAGKRNDQWNNGSHMYDWDSFASIAGTGGGVEKINLGFARMDVNLYAFDSANNGGKGTQPNNDGYGFQESYNLNTWLKQIGGTGLDVNLLLANDSNNKDEVADPNGATNGYVVGAIYNFADFFGVSAGCCSWVGAQYGKGILAGDRFGRNGWGYANLDDTTSWRLSASGVAQLGKVDFQTVIVYQRDENYRGWSQDQSGWNRDFFIAGIRPMHQITTNFAMQYEVGYEYMNDENKAGSETKGGLTKLTVAPTLTFETGYWTRPQIRLFATYASWSEGLMGANKTSYLSQSAAFQDKNDPTQFVTDGMNFGIQGEVWF